MFLYVEDVVFERAIAAGAQELMRVEDSEDGSPPRRGDGPLLARLVRIGRTSRTSRARNSRNGTTL